MALFDTIATVLKVGAMPSTSTEAVEPTLLRVRVASLPAASFSVPPFAVSDEARLMPSASALPEATV